MRAALHLLSESACLLSQNLDVSAESHRESTGLSGRWACAVPNTGTQAGLKTKANNTEGRPPSARRLQGAEGRK